MRFQRHTTPIAGNVTEQPMFNLVPLARTGWIMANLNCHSGLICELLQFIFPKSVPVTVAASAIRCDQEARQSHQSCMRLLA
jgi:hypothetical protein